MTSSIIPIRRAHRRPAEDRRAVTRDILAVLDGYSEAARTGAIAGVVVVAFDGVGDPADMTAVCSPQIADRQLLQGLQRARDELLLNPVT